MDALLYLALGLLLGLPAGYAAERRHLRTWFAAVTAASIATTGDHRQHVLDDYARRQHLGGTR